MIVYDIQDLVKSYPGHEQPVNKHITLQIHQGEIFGILGDNGAGKTTLVRQMVNLLKSTSGHITLFGQDITQDTNLVPEYVGYQYAFDEHRASSHSARPFTCHTTVPGTFQPNNIRSLSAETSFDWASHRRISH